MSPAPVGQLTSTEGQIVLEMSYSTIHEFEVKPDSQLAFWYMRSGSAVSI